jgi:hypothetical protein
VSFTIWHSFAQPDDPKLFPGIPAHDVVVDSAETEGAVTAAAETHTPATTPQVAITHQSRLNIRPSSLTGNSILAVGHLVFKGFGSWDTDILLLDKP